MTLWDTFYKKTVLKNQILCELKFEVDGDLFGDLEGDWTCITIRVHWQGGEVMKKVKV